MFGTRRGSIPGQRVDLVVEGVVLVEIKAVPQAPQAARAPGAFVSEDDGPARGLLVNFNTDVLKNGLQRIVAT